MDFCFDGGGGIFFSGVGGFFKLLTGDGCLFYLGVGWCSNYWKIMGGDWWGPDKNQFDGWWELKFVLMGGGIFLKVPPTPPPIISGIALT